MSLEIFCAVLSEILSDKYDVDIKVFLTDKNSRNEEKTA